MHPGALAAGTVPQYNKLNVPHDGSNYIPPQPISRITISDSLHNVPVTSIESAYTHVTWVHKYTENNETGNIRATVAFMQFYNRSVILTARHNFTLKKGFYGDIMSPVTIERNHVFI